MLPAEKRDVKPNIFGSKGMGKTCAEVYLRKRVEEFLDKVGVVGARHHIRDGQQRVKLTFLIAAVAETAMQLY